MSDTRRLLCARTVCNAHTQLIRIIAQEQLLHGRTLGHCYLKLPAPFGPKLF
jgi:hypothetical protein